MSGIPLPGTEVEDFAFQHSSPHSLRQPSTFSSPPAPPLEDPTSTAFDYNVTEDPFVTDAPPVRSPKSLRNVSELSDRRISGRSSISSFPASVLHHDERPHSRHDSFSNTPSPRRNKATMSAFRHPSSILEMQLNDETGDDTESIVSHRRSGSRMSVRSHGSAHSSPSKRGSRSMQSSPKKSSGLRKEFPLVLLHCTLLPPSYNWLAPTCDEDLFAALLPDGYRQRWTQLQDKLSSAELKTRGILLPHPQEEYELLEERLLEALELEAPRIQNSHFVDRGGDSGFESGSQTESDDAEDKCPDCGKQMGKSARRWEIKVFAANGLMRGAAWSAAWRDMEKVDVEVGLWMPEDIRHEVNARLEALRAAEQEAQMQDEAMRGHEEHPPTFEPEPENIRSEPQPSYAPHPAYTPQPPSIGPLQLLLSDRRNLAIALLSMVVLVYAILNARSTSTDQVESPIAPIQNLQTTVITSTEVWTSTIVAQEPSSVLLQTQPPTIRSTDAHMPTTEAAIDQDHDLAEGSVQEMIQDLNTSHTSATHSAATPSTGDQALANASGEADASMPVSQHAEGGHQQFSAAAQPAVDGVAV